eukprot:3941156-Rhodomonas_salina.5
MCPTLERYTLARRRLRCACSRPVDGGERKCHVTLRRVVCAVQTAGEPQDDADHDAGAHAQGDQPRRQA